MFNFGLEMSINILVTLLFVSQHTASSHAVTSKLLSLLAVIVPVCSGYEIRTYASPNPVMVNSPANLTCQRLLLNDKPKIYSIYWWVHRYSTDVSENCFAYHTSDYSVWCDHPEDSRLATIFILTIKRVLWQHRGNWECRYGFNSSNIFLDVVVPAKIESFLVAPVYTSLEGDGTVTNPYDLTQPDSQGLTLTCTTTCSYPYVRPLISFDAVDVQLGNRTRDLPPDDWVANSEWICGGEAEGQQAGVTRVLVANCSALGLAGKTRFTCQVGNYIRHVYVMCPVARLKAHRFSTPLLLLIISSALLITCALAHFVTWKITWRQARAHLAIGLQQCRCGAMGMQPVNQAPAAPRMGATGADMSCPYDYPTVAAADHGNCTYEQPDDQNTAHGDATVTARANSVPVYINWR